MAEKQGKKRTSFRKYEQKNGQWVHHLVWKQHNGKIPDKHVVHHINGNHLDNRIENLMLCTTREHGRIHAKRYVKRNGEWLRVCCHCLEERPLSEYIKGEHSKPNNAGKKYTRYYYICNDCNKAQRTIYNKTYREKRKRKLKISAN